MTIQLYLDEDSVNHALVIALRSHGADVETALEANLIGKSDEDQLDYARLKGRVLYSFNVRDFFRIHAEVLSEGESHSGIVLCQQQRFSIGEQMRRLLKLRAELSKEEMVDRLEFLNDWG